MSGYDDIYAAVVASREQRHAAQEGGGFGLFENRDLQRIGRALDRARAAKGPLEEHFVLPDYPGQSANLTMDGAVIGNHGLVLLENDRCYQAHTVVPGQVLPLLLVRRAFWRDAARDKRDRSEFGPEVPVPVRDFPRYLVRCDSVAEVAAFLTDDMVAAIAGAHGALERVALLPGPSGIQLDVLLHCGTIEAAPACIAVARAAHRATVHLAGVAGGFTARGPSVDGDTARIPELQRDLEAATSFLAGHVERIGDGVEARMELDQPPGLRGAARMSPVGSGGVRLAFHGALATPAGTRVTLRPERTYLERARGLFDKKLGDPELDAAFLVDGDVQAARLLLTESDAALRLVARGAVLSLDANGIQVQVDELPHDDDAPLQAVAASLALWRGAAQRQAGVTRSGNDP